MEKLGQVINVDKAYIENLISKHGSIREAKFENRPLSEYKNERRVVLEKEDLSGWSRCYDQELIPMYVEKCHNRDRIVFGDTRGYNDEDGKTVYHRYRWPIADYGRDWRLREITHTEYDYSKAKDLFKR